MIFVGAVPEYQKFGAYLDADVFVTPRFYGLPLTFLEAMLCGTPIVTTKGGDRIGWIDNNVGLVSEHSEQGLASAIRRILTDDVLAMRLRTNASESISEFDWARICDSIERLYENITGGRE